MIITKFGHCCLLIEEQGLRILTDPGIYSDQQNSLQNIDLILITHEHSDHLHVDSLTQVLRNNPTAKVMTNPGVGKLLTATGLSFQLLTQGDSIIQKEVTIEAYGETHAPIYSTTPRWDNTGYFIAGRLFYPGDAFTKPGKPVEILALPVAGPWLKLSESIDYAALIAPKICFPVHDGILKQPGTTNSVPATALESRGVKWIVPEIGQAFSV